MTTKQTFQLLKSNNSKNNITFGQQRRPRYLSNIQSQWLRHQSELSHSTCVQPAASYCVCPALFSFITFSCCLLLVLQAAHTPRWHLHVAGALHGHAVHARVVVSCLDSKRQSGQHLITRVYRSLAESNESSKSNSRSRSWLHV